MNRISLTLLLIYFLVCCGNGSFEKTERLNYITDKMEGITITIDTTNILNREISSVMNLYNEEDLVKKQKVRDIPQGIRELFFEITGDNILADPGENWNAGCVNIENLPKRQLTYFGMNGDIAILGYKVGGWGVSSKFLAVKLDKDKINGFWAGSLSRDIDTLEEFLSLVKMDIRK